MDHLGLGFLVLLLAQLAAGQVFTSTKSDYLINNETQFEYVPSFLSRLQLGSFSSNPNITAIEQAEELPTRIVNGKRIPCQRAPYQAALHYKGLFVCGGSILSRYWILTAAHCVAGSNSRRFEVRVGSAQQRRGGQFHRVRLVVPNREYSSKSMRNDLAMLRLATPLRYGNCVQPVKLPSGRRKQLPDCFLVSGWGLSRASALNVQRFLRATVVCTVPHNRCRQMYHRGGVRIYRQMLCAQRLGHDSCSGDSGGPLALRGTLYGVVSFGIGCANVNYPGVYMNVRRSMPWIRSVFQKYS